MIKKTHTQRHRTLVDHTCIVELDDCAGSGTLVPGQRPRRSMKLTRLIPDIDFRFLCENQPVSRRSSIALWDFCVPWMGRTDMKLFKITQKATISRGAVGTSSRTVACALASKPQLPSFVDLSICAVASTFKKNKNHSSTHKRNRIHSFAQVRHRQLQGSASGVLRPRVLLEGAWPSLPARHLENHVYVGGPLVDLTTKGAVSPVKTQGQCVS